MAGHKELADILNECLDRLAGGESLRGCLASYPKIAEELRPLLETAIAARKTIDIEPDPQFKAQARYEIGAAVREAAAQKRRPFFSWQGRWAVAVASLLLVLLMTGGGVAVAASKSMPDSGLYPVKLAIEQVLLRLSPSAGTQAELLARMADSRVTEIVYLAQSGNTAQIETAVLRLDSYLTRIVSLAAAQTADNGALSATDQPPLEADASRKDSLSVWPLDGELAQLLEYYAANHPEAIRRALETAPADVKQVLLRALAISVTGYQDALDAIER
ncbi:MAG: DUF5667 domain-containing protein [Dehalococcoidales bacterium]